MPEYSGRRQVLEDLKFELRTTHAGLWFDRYFMATQGDDAKRNHMDACAQIGVAPIYSHFFERWKTSLPADAQCAVASVQGRMVIGSGAKGVADAGICLHHTYGVPYIPGSALKGMAASYANCFLVGFDESAADPDQLTPYQILFGSEQSAGYLTFFDALYMPGTTKDDRPLALDVITTHHPSYYVGDQPTPPADWDSPTPVPFLTATGNYLIAVAGEATWVATALQIIGMALRDSGIGAKTSAGYGRMILKDMDGQPITLPSWPGATKEEQSSAQQVVHTLSPTFELQLSKSNASNIGNIVHQWRDLPAELQPLAAQKIIAHAQLHKIRNFEQKHPDLYAMLEKS